MFTMFAALTAFLLAGVIYGIYKSDSQAEQDYGFSETPAPQVPVPTPVTDKVYLRVSLGIEQYGSFDYWSLYTPDGEEYTLQVRAWN